MFTEIKYLFPNAVPLIDFELQDNSDGKGPFILKWDETKLGPRLTLAQLASAKGAAIAAEQSKKEQLTAESYLLSTDWYVLRKVETGVEIPIEISAQRNAARTKLSR